MKKTIGKSLSSHDLITHLTKQLVAKNPIHIGFELAKWVLITLPILAVGALYFHLRPDLTAQLASESFYQTLVLIGGSAGLIIFGAFISGIPGRSNEAQPFFIAGLSALGLWIATLVNPIFHFFLNGQTPAIDAGIMCSVMVTILGSIPFIAAAALIRKLAPTQLRKTGFFALFGAAITGNVGLHFICPATDTLHILIWHVMPILILGSLGWIIGRQVFKW